MTKTEKTFAMNFILVMLSFLCSAIDLPASQRDATKNSDLGRWIAWVCHRVRGRTEVRGQPGSWILVYKVDEQKCVWRPDRMDWLVAAIRSRVNANWWNGISVKGLAAGQSGNPPATPRNGCTAQEKTGQGRTLSARSFARQVHWNSDRGRQAR